MSGLIKYIDQEVGESTIVESLAYKESFLKTFLSFMTISMGLSLHNGIAVLEGFFGRKTPFIRTPKFNASNSDAGTKNNVYVNNTISISSIAEFLLGLYFIGTIILGIYLRDYGLILFHAMLAIGFITVSYQTIRLRWYAG